MSKKKMISTYKELIVLSQITKTEILCIKAATNYI